MKLWNHKYSIINTTFFALLVMLYIYSIHLTFMPNYIQTNRIILMMGIVYGSLEVINKKHITISKSVIAIYTSFCFYFLWIASRSFTDVSLVTSTISLLTISFLGAICISFFLYRRNYNFHRTLHLIHLAITLQALFIIISFLSEGFREFTYTYISSSSNIDPLRIDRVRGLASHSGAGLSSIQGMGLFIATYLLSLRLYVKYIIYYGISIMLILLSILYTGNTGLLVVVPIIIYFLIRFFNEKQLKLNSVQNMLLLVIVGIFVWLGFNYFIPHTNLGEDFLARSTRRTKAEFVVSDDSFLPRTVPILVERHYHLPNDRTVFLFGDIDT